MIEIPLGRYFHGGSDEACGACSLKYSRYRRPSRLACGRPVHLAVSSDFRHQCWCRSPLRFRQGAISTRESTTGSRGASLRSGVVARADRSHVTSIRATAVRRGVNAGSTLLVSPHIGRVRFRGRLPGVIAVRRHVVAIGERASGGKMS